MEWSWLDHGFGTRASNFWPPPSKLAMAKQVHSDRILRAGESAGYIGEGDALVSNNAGIYVGVRTADCQPILIVDPDRRVVAAIHAGWRGTAARIAAKAVGRLRRDFGSDSTRLVVAIGPCIRACCFEVGPEVAIQFKELFPERDGELGKKTHLDLTEANRRQIAAAGVPDRNIHIVPLCTFCSNEFHSYRRDKDKGRMVSAIGIIG
ncbi:MAG: peptidoglycan editing factor PgeF [Bryobacterales bacterium]|nr:peptidoglycan editing factor PgeF [Bryobacterales bacterium]MEB2362411.1 peptidoglycan editing factor PgeF [Bryobacterales bacterium]